MKKKLPHNPWYFQETTLFIIRWVLLLALTFSYSIGLFSKDWFLVCISLYALFELTLLLKKQVFSNSQKSDGEGHDEANRKLQQVSAEKESVTQKLYEKIRQHGVLYELIGRITATLNMKEIFELTVKRTKEELHAEIGFLILIEEGRLVIECSEGLTEFGKQAFESPLGHKPFGDLVLKGETFRVKREQPLHPVFQSLVELNGTDKIRDLIVVPLKSPIPDHPARGLLGVANSLHGDGFNQEQLEIMSILAGQATVAMENAEAILKEKEFFKETIGALAAAINQKHAYTHVLHSKSVAKWAVDIAKELRFSSREIEKIEIASILHDIGKIAIPDEVLTKPASLNSEELEIMNQHPDKGAEILKGISWAQDILPLIRHHHERWDGSGYPGHLKGEEIPMGAQIVAIADTFDAVIANRPYHKGLTKKEALEEIQNQSGKQFNPKVVEAFIKVMNRQAVPRSISLDGV